MVRWDEIAYAIRNLLHRKVRSWLTILSILIGIMAIFSIVSFGLGLQSYVDTLAEQAGRDKLFLQAKGIGAPGTDSNFQLTRDDLEFVGRITGVKEITGMYFKAAEVEYKREKEYQFAIGIDIDDIELIEEVFQVDIVAGRQLKKGELDSVVLGYNYQIDNKIFKRGLQVGDSILIDGNEFDIVGFYDEVGNPSDDANIYMTLDAMEALVPESKDIFSYVMIRAQKGVDTQDLADKIEERLRKHKGQEEGKEDFYVQTLDDVLQTFNTILLVLNGILFLIAMISLIVAFVNIMNTMYTAVLERTKEIGIMKAIGAKNSDILFVFVFESGLLGMIGGIIGVILGYFVSSAGGAFAANAGFALLKPIFPWYLVVGCILFSFFVGALAGMLPAYQASKLKPVDALRYE